LLSDGEFSDPTAAYLRSNNRIRASDSTAATQIAVHTVCFYSQDGHRMLQRIADENGGRCSIIGASGVP
jgi:hypothetical protein